MTVIFTYDASKNPHGGGISGVPLRDLTKADIDGMPPHAVASVRAAAFYVVVLDEPEAPKKKSRRKSVAPGEPAVTEGD